MNQRIVHSAAGGVYGVFFSEMKVICFAFAACLCFAVAKACQRQQWRSHTIICCTALIQRDKNVWVPEMKAPEMKANKSKEVSELRARSV